MNNSVTIAYRFELHFNTTSLDRLKPGNIDELQASSNKIPQEHFQTLIILVERIVDDYVYWKWMNEVKDISKMNKKNEAKKDKTEHEIERA
ncbi:hypothetical protein Tco_0467724 [Tanacetum coccineum]